MNMPLVHVESLDSCLVPGWYEVYSKSVSIGGFVGLTADNGSTMIICKIQAIEERKTPGFFDLYLVQHIPSWAG